MGVVGVVRVSGPLGFSVRPPFVAWMFWALAGVEVCVGVTSAVAFALDPSSDVAWFAGRRFMWAFIYVWIGSLLYDNHRLSTTPAWRAASDGFQRGWEKCAESYRAIAAAEARKRPR